MTGRVTLIGLLLALGGLSGAGTAQEADAEPKPGWKNGVHILELHDLEALARDQVWEFCYMATTNKLAGTTAGFALRPIALR